jgi:hypothetical protein
LQSAIEGSAIVEISDYEFCACLFEGKSRRLVWVTHQGANLEIAALQKMMGDRIALIACSSSD